MYSTHTGPIGCIMLIVWPYKYKLGHIDLILIIHHIHMKNLNFPMCHMCMLCESRVMYQSICVFVYDHHVFYSKILYEYHMEQFFMFQQLTIMWYSVQYLYHM